MHLEVQFVPFYRDQPLVAHDLYESIDLASLALLRIDEKDGGERQERYVDALVKGLAAV